ncbi:MAG: hypothetical protein ACHQFW_12090 [Chitinophagales bacterium]
MSDLAWIALLIILYMVIIKPMMQGMVQPERTNTQQRTEVKKNSPSSEKKSGNKNDDYVDYEEVK